MIIIWMPEDSICGLHTIVNGAGDLIMDIGDAIIIDKGWVVIVVAQLLWWNALMEGIRNLLVAIVSFCEPLAEEKDVLIE